MSQLNFTPIPSDLINEYKNLLLERDEVKEELENVERRLEIICNFMYAILTFLFAFLIYRFSGLFANEITIRAIAGSMLLGFLSATIPNFLISAIIYVIVTNPIKRRLGLMLYRNSESINYRLSEVKEKMLRSYFKGVGTLVYSIDLFQDGFNNIKYFTEGECHSLWVSFNENSGEITVAG